MDSLIGEKRFSESQQNIAGTSAKKPRLGDKGLNSIISVNPTFKLHARLTFKSMKTFENGKDYQLTNWIDCEATEFVGLSFGKIALHYNDELQENYIYCITNAVVSIITQDNSRISLSKGITLNKQTLIERVNYEATEVLNFPNISYSYKLIEEIIALDLTIEKQRIDFIGIFFEWIEVGKKMSLKTPSGKLIVNVEKAISQVCHQDFIEMIGLPRCATVSFKDLQMDGDVFSCFNDTIIKINRFCPQSHELADWLEDTLERNEPDEENWYNGGSSEDSGVFGFELPNPNLN